MSGTVVVFVVCGVMFYMIKNLKFMDKHYRFNVQSCHFQKELMYFHSFFHLLDLFIIWYWAKVLIKTCLKMILHLVFY